jgi:hypothetical protein
MMSCTTSAACSRPVLLFYCTEHGMYRGAILSGCITSVGIFKSGQLGRRCTIEPHCSGMYVLQTLR